MDLILAAAGGSAATWVVTKVLDKTIGTKHVTAVDCQNCETRRSVNQIKDMVLELAIKAGVPPHEAIKAVNGKGKD